MKLSLKSRYGMKAIYELAQNYGSGPLSIKVISEKQAIPASFLEQLMAKLRRGGLIRSVRGPGGGYVLNRAPSQINVGEVVRALEGPIFISACTNGDRWGKCSQIENCGSRFVWYKLKQKIEEVLDNTTLEDISKMTQRERRGDLEKNLF